MAQRGKTSSMPQPFHRELFGILVSGAKQRLRLIQQGKSKARNNYEAFEKASLILHNAYFYTLDESTARSFIKNRHDLIDLVLPPTFKKRLDKLCQA